MKIILSLLLLTASCFAASPSEKREVKIHAVSHDIHLSSSGASLTSCYRAGALVNCSNYGGFESISVTEVVDVGKDRYILRCDGVPFRSAIYRLCLPLDFDGDDFDAEIKRNQVTVFTRIGGNQGRPTKMKYVVTDIRPSSQ